MKVDGPQKGGGRPKRTWMTVVTINMKECDLFEVWPKIDRNGEIKFLVADPNVVETRL